MLPLLCFPGCDPVQGAAGDMGNPPGSSSAQVPPPSAAAELATSDERPVWGRSGGQRGAKRARWRRRVHAAYLHGQGGLSVLWSRLGYGEAMEKLVSLILKWKEALRQARQTRGEARDTQCGLQGVGFGALHSVANNSSVTLCTRIWLSSSPPWHSEGETLSSLQCLPCLCIALHLFFFFCLGSFFSFFFFCPLTPL